MHINTCFTQFSVDEHLIESAIGLDLMIRFLTLKGLQHDF